MFFPVNKCRLMEQSLIAFFFSHLIVKTLPPTPLVHGPAAGKEHEWSDNLGAQLWVDKEAGLWCWEGKLGQGWEEP